MNSVGAFKDLKWKDLINRQDCIHIKSLEAFINVVKNDL